MFACIRAYIDTWDFFPFSEIHISRTFPAIFTDTAQAEYIQLNTQKYVENTYIELAKTGI